MVKIKTKKQLTLPQLIEWAIDNNIKHRVFESNPNFDGVTYELGFDIDGDLYFEEYLTPTSLFTVEVEEELTEDTKLDLVERFIGGMGYACYTSHGNMTIRECLKRSPEECTTTHFYIENDNRELVLIWQDGNLI